jgi:hypothetical protein
MPLLRRGRTRPQQALPRFAPQLSLSVPVVTSVSMRLAWSWLAAVIVCVVCMALWLGVSRAEAAFAGSDGVLAVQPLSGSGVILVAPGGSVQHRICPVSAGCRAVGAAKFSPDGRSLVFATRTGLRIVSIDGRCVDCQFGRAAAPGFTPDGTAVTFVNGGALLQDGIDSLHQATVLKGGISTAAWSSTGALAVVRHGGVWIGSPNRMRSIGKGHAPSWSPDATKLALVRHGWVMIVGRTGQARRLVRGSAPAFAPNGKAVAYIGASHELRTVSIAGGASHEVGHVHGRSVDWQPLPARARACVAPAGSRVIAQTAKAVVTEHYVPGPDGYSPKYAYMGCLFSDGQERLLEKFTTNNVDGITSVSTAGVGGDYAALVNAYNDPHYGDYSDSVTEFDLRTGAPARPLPPGFLCPNQGEYDCAMIDHIVVASDGAYAVHTQGGSLCSSPPEYQSCWLETIDAHDKFGPRTLDEATSALTSSGFPSTGPALTGLTLSGTTVTWDHAGAPRSAELG